MYEACFGLKRRPFAATPDSQCFLASGPMQAALDELVICVEQGQGVAVVSAPAGTGKTLLCERLRSELGDRFESVFLRHASFLTRRALLQTILCELHHPYRQFDEQELRLELFPAIRALRPQREALVLICDEAHQLTEDLLEELRILSDLAEQGRPLVRLVLVGQLGLEETLALPNLEALSQRIRAHICLETLDRAGSLDYIDYRLTWAGGRTDEVFTPEALELISRAADGVPRCINQLCDHALLLAYVAEQQPVEVEMIREALQDLRQLPLHWNETSLGETSHREPISSEAESPAEPMSLTHEGGSVELPWEMESIEIGADLPNADVSCSPALSAVGSNAEDTIATQPVPEAASGPLAATGEDEETLPGPAQDENRVETMIAPLAGCEIEPVSTVETGDADAPPPAVELVPVPPGGFMEELVLDRYAAIDAGFAPPELMQPDTAQPLEVRSTSNESNEMGAVIASTEEVSRDLMPLTDESISSMIDVLTTVDSTDSNAVLAETSDVDNDDGFDAVCERLDEWLPQAAEESPWDAEGLHDNELHDEPRGSILETSSSAIDVRVESSTLEELLGAEVCEIAEELRRGLGQPARDNSLFERLQAELETADQDAPATVASTGESIDTMATIPQACPTPEATPAQQVSTRPYRNLFSLLRRKQQGLL